MTKGYTLIEALITTALVAFLFVGCAVVMQQMAVTSADTFPQKQSQMVGIQTLNAHLLELGSMANYVGVSSTAKAWTPLTPLSADAISTTTPLQSPGFSLAFFNGEHTASALFRLLDARDLSTDDRANVEQFCTEYGLTTFYNSYIAQLWEVVDGQYHLTFLMFLPRANNPDSFTAPKITTVPYGVVCYLPSPFLFDRTRLLRTQENSTQDFPQLIICTIPANYTISL